jgi:tetratricopeptide (TPR) repeat protein
MARLISNPMGSKDVNTIDLVAVGKLHEDLGHLFEAKNIYEHCLEKKLPGEIRSRTVKRLSYLCRKLNLLPDAMSLWWQAAADREIYAHEELAKYYEHKVKDLEEAKKWTEAALALIKMPEINRFEKFQWQEKLEYRLNRLKRKIK